ncbi:hypothetical protein BH24DEI2_BH24DEI2_14720 [soil metagenome]
MLEKLGDFFNQDPQRQDDYHDFQRRFEADPDQLSDAEAARRYRELMAQADTQDQAEDHEAEQAYDEAFGKLSQSERRALAERYREATSNDARPYQGYPQGQDLEQASSPRELGRMTRKAAQQDPDLLEQVVGPNSPLSGTGGRMALAGLAVFAAKRFLGNR